MKILSVGERVFVTHKDPGHYRPNDPCEIIGVFMVTPWASFEPRLCYKVRFEDGEEDYIAMEPNSYRIKTLKEILNQK